MVRVSTLAALCFAAFVHVPSFETFAGQDAGGLTRDDIKIFGALKNALGERRCNEASRLIKQGELREFQRPIVRFFQGGMYQFGICAPRDAALAADAYRSAAVIGHDISQLQLGRLYLEGLGVEQDEGKAREWFKHLMYGMLNEADDERLGWIRNWWGEGELPKILMEELAWLRRVEGDPRSRMRVGVKILAGDGLPRDVKAAQIWLERAADAELPEAMLKLAQLKMNGKVEQYHYTEGAMMLYKVASVGYLPAIVEYATRLVEGDGLGKSDFYAYPWLLRAKEAGAPVDELLAVVGERIGKAGRDWGEGVAGDGGRLPLHLPPR